MVGTRRELLGLLAALPLVGCGRDASGLTELQYWGTGTLDVGQKNWKLAEEAARVRVRFTDNGNDLGPVLAQMVSGTAAGDYDLGGVQGGAEPEMFRAGKILPWDTSKIAQWEHIWPWVRDIPYLKSAEGHQIGLPVVANADSIIYREDQTGVVESYEAVFDRRFRGRASMEDSWMNSVIFAAIYMKARNIDSMARIQDPGNLEEDDLRTVIEFLKRHKRDGQFYKFWNGWEDGVDLIASGRVVVMTGWEPIVLAARERGAADVKYAAPEEGYEGWSNNLVLHSGVRSPEKARRGVEDAAYRFANWQLAGTYGCILGAMRGYMVPTGSCVSLLERGPLSYTDTTSGAVKQVSLDQAQELEAHVREKFERRQGKVHWQNARPKNYALYESLWAELRTT